MKPQPLMMLMMLIMITAIVYAVIGNVMHAQVTNLENEFHASQEQYWNIDKATRDSAPANSALTNQLAELQQTPSNLIRLKLIGVGRILTGIFVLLFGILIALIVMPVRLAKFIKGKK